MHLQHFLVLPSGPTFGTSGRGYRYDKAEIYYLIMLFQGRSQEAATRKLQNILKDFTFLVKMLKGLGEQVEFSSIFLVGDCDPDRRRRAEQLNE